MPNGEARLGKCCSVAGCRVWNRPHPVGEPFDKGQQCFKCKCILYQGPPKDKYPGKHHRPQGRSRAVGDTDTGSAGSPAKGTSPKVPAVGAPRPTQGTPWGINRQQRELQKLETLRKENADLKQQLAKDKEGEAESAEPAGSDHSKTVKDCRSHLTRCKDKVVEAEKWDDKEELAIWKPRKAKAEAALQEALDKLQAAKPLDQRQRELEREVRRLEASCEKQEDANRDLTKKKEEAIAAEAAGQEKVASLKEQLLQAKKKLDTAKGEQEAPGTGTGSQALLPRAGESEEEYAKRRLSLTQAILPPDEQPDECKQQSLLSKYAMAYNEFAAKGSVAPSEDKPQLVAPIPEKRERDGEGDDEMGEFDIDALDDDACDQLYALGGGGLQQAEPALSPEELAKRRANTRAVAASRKDQLGKVFNTFLKQKKQSKA